MKVAKEETELKSALMSMIRTELPNYVALRHEDVRTSGIPDISITAFGRTSWWEVKHATPKFLSKEIQERTMKRLEAGGFARYIIYYELNGVRRTLIVRPHLLDLNDLIPERSYPGFDHRFVLDSIQSVHRPVG